MFEEQENYEKLIRPIEDQMLRSVWGITQNAEDAEEAFQDALAVIWRKWEDRNIGMRGPGLISCSTAPRRHTTSWFDSSPTSRPRHPPAC